MEVRLLPAKRTSRQESYNSCRFGKVGLLTDALYRIKKKWVTKDELAIQGLQMFWPRSVDPVVGKLMIPENEKAGGNCPHIDLSNGARK